MARYLMRIRTDRPPAEVYGYLADVRNFADWDPGTKAARQVKGNGPGPGAEYDLDTAGATLRYVVDAYDPPVRIRLTGRNRFVTSVDTISVTADGQHGGQAGAVVTYEADLTGNGPFRVLEPVLKLAFNRLGDKSAEGLVDALDGERLA